MRFLTVKQSAIALVLATNVMGCTPPVSLHIATPPKLSFPLTKQGSLRIAAPEDKRPQQEIIGKSAPCRYVVPLVFLNFLGWRGTEFTGNADFVPEAWQELHDNLVRQATSTGLFSKVSTDEPTDYLLETEVLHLAGARYIMKEGFFSPGGAFADMKSFHAHAAVILRLRLSDSEGHLIGQRVVNANTMEKKVGNGPREIVVAALDKALLQVRALLASWVLEHRYAAIPFKQLANQAENEHDSDHSFLVHMVNEDRTAVHFLRIACPSGQVISKRTVNNIPIVGKPGQWILSPYDEHGIRIASSVYDALSRHLAKHFFLRRTDQIAAYRFGGKRKQSVATVVR